MNLVAAVTVFAVVVTLASSAAAQGSRGFSTGSGSSSGFGQSGAPAGPPRGGTPGSGQTGAPAGPPRGGTPGSPTGTMPPRPGLSTAPGPSIQSPPRAVVPQVTVPRFDPPVVHGGVPVAPHGTPGLATGTTTPAPGGVPTPN